MTLTYLMKGLHLLPIVWLRFEHGSVGSWCYREVGYRIKGGNDVVLHKLTLLNGSS